MKMKNEFGFIEEVEFGSERMHTLIAIETKNELIDAFEKRLNQIRRERDILYRLYRDKMLALYSSKYDDVDLIIANQINKLMEEYDEICKDI